MNILITQEEGRGKWSSITKVDYLICAGFLKLSILFFRLGNMMQVNLSRASQPRPFLPVPSCPKENKMQLLDYCCTTKQKVEAIFI